MTLWHILSHFGWLVWLTCALKCELDRWKFDAVEIGIPFSRYSDSFNSYGCHSHISF
jgi:hypothetical protein